VLKLRSYEHSTNNITIEKSLDENLPDIMVDCFQIQQVFLNIMLNAEQAVAEKRSNRLIKITTEKDDKFIRIIFTDNGPGIAPGNISRVFNPFFTTRGVGKGTGLGLSIAFGIINKHNGTINVQSEYGHGATFIVELPILPSTVEEIMESVEQYGS
jgi:signal transduction histidine kinase